MGAFVFDCDFFNAVDLKFQPNDCFFDKLRIDLNAALKRFAAPVVALSLNDSLKQFRLVAFLDFVANFNESAEGDLGGVMINRTAYRIVANTFNCLIIYVFP